MLPGSIKLHNIYYLLVLLLHYVDSASCGGCTMVQCKHTMKMLGCQFWKSKLPVVATLLLAFGPPEENTGSAPQQLGVLDQQLRKLLASPGLPAVSPISLPFPAVSSEGWVQVIWSDRLLIHGSRVLVAEATEVACPRASAACLRTQLFFAGGKSCYFPSLIARTRLGRLGLRWFLVQGESYQFFLGHVGEFAVGILRSGSVRLVGHICIRRALGLPRNRSRSEWFIFRFCGNCCLNWAWFRCRFLSLGQARL